LDVPTGKFIHPCVWLEKTRKRDRWMIHQPLANARHVRDDVDAMILQFKCWANAGAQ
jgi:hypothetical protein